MSKMARLIEADALKANFVVLGEFANDLWHAGAIRSAIDNAPTVDAVPVVHGAWVAVPSSDMMTGKAYKCSECGKMRYGSFMPNYCAICGAKMDLKEESDA